MARRRNLRRHIARFDAGGNVAIVAALLLPAMLLAAGGAVDFHRYGQKRSALQEFADTLALRGAREFMLANAQPSSIENIVAQAAEGLSGQHGIASYDLDVRADGQARSVAVSVVEPPIGALMLARISPFGNEIAVDATAAARGGSKVCVVALDESAQRAVFARDSATLDAASCSVLSNSDSQSGVAAENRARISASLICSAGGYFGGGGNFAPTPTTDCPVYPDPLAERAPPPVGPCDHYNFEVGYVTSSGSNNRRLISGTIETAASSAELPLIHQTVSPGVYCGGLRIKTKAEVTFEPGIYVIKDGPLQVGEMSVLDGEGVGFYLVGNGATFRFDPGAKIAMSGPRTGPMAGILFFEDRAAPLHRVHQILSNDARKFIGTFYLPRGTLLVNTQVPVADASAYTAIVARRLELSGAPRLVLNSNYAATDVPVPDGVGPVGVEVYLRD